MKIIKDLITASVIGMMIGATVYLGALMLHVQLTPPTPRTIAGLFVMSALIGMLALIFDNESLSLPVAYSLHFIGTFAIVIGTNYLMGWQFLVGSALPNFLIAFLIIYVLIWLALYLSWQVTARKMNHVLKKRQGK